MVAWMTTTFHAGLKPPNNWVSREHTGCMDNWSEHTGCMCMTNTFQVSRYIVVAWCTCSHALVC